MVEPSEGRPSRAKGMLELGVVLALAGVGVAAGLQASAAKRSSEEAERHRPVQRPAAPYVTSAECRSCHPTHYDSWFQSYHRTMTQLASPESVRGDFDGVALGDHRLSREGEAFFVDVPNPIAGSDRYPISLVTGSHHLQIYWYETGEGRSLGQLPYAYLIAERRWVPRGSVFLEPPGEVRPTEAGRWNQSCIACHTTQGKPRQTQGRFDTHVAEFGIACEACHGPGGEHVQKQSSPMARYRSHFEGADDPTIVHPGKLDHRRASEVCSQCHAMWQHAGDAGLQTWNEHGFSYRPGDDPAKSMWLLQPSRRDEDSRVEWVTDNHKSYVAGQFWRDGMARVSGREFSGMIDSPCYERGELSCLSCHTMHKPADDPRTFAAWANDQLGVGMDGDQACLQCHSDYAAKLAEHTHHAPESSGSRCMNCHMPYTSYGLLTAMRSHRIDVPDARATTFAGRPNACNGCHLDRTLAWTAEHLQARYGIEPPELDEEQRTIQTSLLLGVKGDAGQRALIAWAAGWKPAVEASPGADLPALLGLLMDDPYDAVRFIAERSLRGLAGVDSAGLDYDYVERPSARAPVASRVAGLPRTQPSELSAADRARLRQTMARLLPLRNQRPVLLLE